MVKGSDFPKPTGWGCEKDVGSEISLGPSLDSSSDAQSDPLSVCRLECQSGFLSVG